MPYIKSDVRKELDGGGWEPEDEGELNYKITSLICTYLGNAPRYGNYNAVIGVLECVKLELYRRMVAPYEDEKCNTNGDVYR